MPLEIERKFLVATDAWRREAGGSRRLRQAYLAHTEKAVVRVRIDGDAGAVLTVKSAAPGLSRQEFEYPVPVEHALELLELRAGSIVEKTRFEVRHEGRFWEVDVYEGENSGLVLAEIELESETAAFGRPSWIGAEVTGDPRFYAARLARHPFGSWRE